MSKKQWFLGACGLMLISGVASAKVVSVGVVVPGAVDNKVLIDHVGQKVQMDVWFTVIGDDTNAVNENFALMGGSLLSYLNQGKTAVGKGKFNPLGAMRIDENTGEELGQAWWNDMIGGGNGSMMGKEQNLSYDSPFGKMLDDGSPDVGNAGFVDALTLGDWIYVRAPNTIKGGTFLNPLANAVPPLAVRIQNGSGQNVGYKLKAISFEWEVTELASGLNETAVGWMPRLDSTQGGLQMSSNTGVWTIDGALANYDFASPDSLKLDAPVILYTVPEPASLSLLAFGALGLLARRRK